MWKVFNNLATILQQSCNNLSRSIGSAAYPIMTSLMAKITNMHTYNCFINLVFYICKIVNNPAKYQTIFLDPYFITVPKFLWKSEKWEIYWQNKISRFVTILNIFSFLQKLAKFWFWYIDAWCNFKDLWKKYFKRITKLMAIIAKNYQKLEFLQIGHFENYQKYFFLKIATNCIS